MKDVTVVEKRFAVIRIIFGLVWGIDAFLKWQPAFMDNFAANFSTGPGMLAVLSYWINFLGGIVSHDPHLFAVLVALAESFIALALVFGFMVRPALVLGALLSLGIWSSVEMFGMFWTPGATDLGTSVAYILVFAALWCGESWKAWSLDAKLFLTQ